MYCKCYIRTVENTIELNKQTDQLNGVIICSSEFTVEFTSCMLMFIPGSGVLTFNPPVINSSIGGSNHLMKPQGCLFLHWWSAQLFTSTLYSHSHYPHGEYWSNHSWLWHAHFISSSNISGNNHSNLSKAPRPSPWCMRWGVMWRTQSRHGTKLICQKSYFPLQSNRWISWKYHSNNRTSSELRKLC
jgi:hypothetical protein